VGRVDNLIVQLEELNRIQKLLNFKCNSGNGYLFSLEYEKEESHVIRKWVDILYVRLVKKKDRRSRN